MPTPPATTDGDELPIPEEWVSYRADATKVAAWWAEWEKLPPIERSRPAAEVLAEVRGETSDDADHQ